MNSDVSTENAFTKIITNFNNESLSDIKKLFDSDESCILDTLMRILCKITFADVLIQNDILKLLVDEFENRNISLDTAIQIANEEKNNVILMVLIHYKTEKYQKKEYRLALAHACKTGNIALIEILSKKIVVKQDDWNSCLENACSGGNIEIIKMAIEKGANDWNSGLLAACEKSHKNIVELMISYISPSCIIHWKDVFMSVCNSGQADLIKLIIAQMKLTENENVLKAFINIGFINTCIKGNLDCVLLMIEHGANEWDDGLDNIIAYDYKEGHDDIIRLLYKNGATEIYNKFYKACKYRDQHAKVLYELYKKWYLDNTSNRSKYIDTIQRGLSKASQCENIDLMAFILNNENDESIASHVCTLLVYNTKRNFNTHENIIYYGANIHKLKKIRGYDIFLEDLKRFKNDVTDTLGNNLIPDLIKMIVDYIIVQ